MFQCMAAPAKDSFDDDDPAKTYDTCDKSISQNINAINTKHWELGIKQ